jgi:hypothetical protein
MNSRVRKIAIKSTFNETVAYDDDTTSDVYTMRPCILNSTFEHNLLHSVSGILTAAFSWKMCRLLGISRTIYFYYISLWVEFFLNRNSRLFFLGGSASHSVSTACTRRGCFILLEQLRFGESEPNGCLCVSTLSPPTLLALLHASQQVLGARRPLLSTLPPTHQWWKQLSYIESQALR